MKKKKNNILPLLALICALAALLLSALGLGSVPEDQSHLINDLYAENAQLKSRVDALEEQLNRVTTAVNLEFWSLDVSPWADSTGADVTFRAIPAVYQPDFSASLIVMLDGEQVTSEVCGWDGTAFTATAALSAADGYSYYCLLATADGSQKLPLTGPDTADAGIPVYLASSLCAYCNFVVNDWIEKPDRSLLLTDAYAQAQLPRISNDGAVEIVTAEVVLRMNGQESVRIPIELAPSEVEGSLELTIKDLRIPMPELGDGDVLELSLEIILSDGRRLDAFGVSWYLEEGKLSSAVG